MTDGFIRGEGLKDGGMGGREGEEERGKTQKKKNADLGKLTKSRLQGTN